MAGGDRGVIVRLEEASPTVLSTVCGMRLENYDRNTPCAMQCTVIPYEECLHHHGIRGAHCAYVTTADTTCDDSIEMGAEAHRDG